MFEVDFRFQSSILVMLLYTFYLTVVQQAEEVHLGYFRYAHSSTGTLEARSVYDTTLLWEDRSMLCSDKNGNTSGTAVFRDQGMAT